MVQQTTNEKVQLQGPENIDKLLFLGQEIVQKWFSNDSGHKTDKMVKLTLWVKESISSPPVKVFLQYQYTYCYCHLYLAVPVCLQNDFIICYYFAPVPACFQYHKIQIPSWLKRGTCVDGKISHSTKILILI